MVLLFEGIEVQIHKIFDNLLVVFKEFGLGLENVVSVWVFLIDFYGDYACFNVVYVSYFFEGKCPVRICIGIIGLVCYVLVEIDFIVCWL